MVLVEPVRMLVARELGIYPSFCAVSLTLCCIALEIVGLFFNARETVVTEQLQIAAISFKVVFLSMGWNLESSISFIES